MNQIAIHSLLNNVDFRVPPREAEGHGFGHCFKVMKEKVETFFIYLFHSIGEAFSKRSPLSKVCKFCISVLTGVATKVGQAFPGVGLLKVLGIVDGVLDVGDLFADVDGIANERYKDKEGRVHKWSLMANISFLVADILGMALWLDELAFISLSHISTCIGNGFSRLASSLGTGFTNFTNAVATACPILAKLAAKVTLVNVLRGVVVGAFCFLAINESRKMAIAIRDRNYQQIVISSLYIASYVAEIALKIMAIAACTNLPGLVVMGCLAAGLGLAAIITEAVLDYRKKRIQQEQQALQQQRVEPQQQPPAIQDLKAAA